MTANQMQDVIQFSIAQLHIASQRVQSKDRLAAINAIEAAVEPLHDVHSELSGAKPQASAPDLSGHASPEQASLYTAVAHD